MAAPTTFAAETPWEGYTFGALLERVLNREGLTNPDTGYAGRDANLAPASAAEYARAKDVVRDCLVALMTRYERFFSSSTATVAAEASSGTYPSVRVPADYGRLNRGGLTIDGKPLKIISQEEYQTHLRPSAEGGGTYLTAQAGAPTHALFQSESVSVGARKVLFVKVFPVQTSAFSAVFSYRATARNLDDEDDTIRLPVTLHPILMKEAMAEYADRGNDTVEAIRRKAVARDMREDADPEDPADELKPGFRQGFNTVEDPLDL